MGFVFHGHMEDVVPSEVLKGSINPINVMGTAA
jgi:hypothetical protein